MYPHGEVLNHIRSRGLYQHCETTRVICRYIQTMLALMDLGSEEVSDDVWFRAVQAVAGSTADRPSTTEAIAKSLESGSLSVPLVSTAGYGLFLKPQHL